MTTEMKAAIAKMQTKRQQRPTIWQNPNGTYSHHKDSQREWDNEDECRFDLRLHNEYRR